MNIFVLVAAAAMALVSCQRQEMPETDTNTSKSQEYLYRFDISANAKSANRRDVFTSRMECGSKETATLFLQSAIDEVLKPYGGRGKFGVEWDFSSENTKVICFVQRGVEVVVTATLF